MDAPERARAVETATAEEREQAFRAYVHSQLADDGTSPVAMPGYRTHLAAWLLWCREHEIQLSEVTVADVRHYRRMLAVEGADQRNISHKCLVLRRFYHGAVNGKFIRENPALGIFPFHGC